MKRASAVSKLVHDARGRLRQWTDLASGTLTVYDYDEAGKLASIPLPRKNPLTFGRKPNGEVGSTAPG